MSVNLIELAKSYFTNSVVEKMALSNDTPADKTQTALNAILPTLAGGLLSKVTSEGNVNWLMDLLKGGNFGPTMLSNLSTMFTGSAAADRTETTGENLTRSLFGNKNDDVAREVANHAGIRKDAASGLMEMAAPVLMSVIGQHMGQQNLGASGLMSLITSQADHIKSALPAGLASLGGLLGVGSLMGTVTTPVTTPVMPATAPVRPAPAAYVNTEPEKTSGGLPGWLIPLVVIVAALGLLWYFMRGCENKTTETGATVVDSTMTSVGEGASAVGDSLQTVAGAAGDAMSDAMASLGEFGKRTLPDGVELNIPANGIENKLVSFIEDKSMTVDKETWFSFDRLEFATGKSTLLPKSQEQLTNIAAILKAYPNVDLKLGGYTDNTGDRAANMKLSDERAKSTMAELERMGVAKSRLVAEGYGPEHPVATNDTPEGRQRNRRIDVRVTKK